MKITALKHLGDQVIAQVADRYGEDSAEHLATKEAWRVYLAWMGAPEVDELSESNLCDLGALSDEAYSLIGKRVRLVEVKE